MNTRATIPADTVQAAAAVRLEDELARRGVRVKGRIELAGPCPVCGGTDRFAINIRKQIWNCRQCRIGGNVIDLVRHIDGCSFVDAVALLAGNSPRGRAISKPAPKPDDRERTADALSIWREARDPRGTLAACYFAHRSLELPNEAAGEAIRFDSACPFGGARTPAMVALVRDVVTDEPKAIHRTALDETGNKTFIDGKDRLALGPVGGGAVKLTANENVTLCLGIGEGIETALSMRLAREFGASPIWALLSAGQVARFPVLGGVEALWIAVDHDKAGIEAAHTCAHRWKATGRDVFLIRSKTEGDDLNDLRRLS
jgi:phage/plasmid primase-like uncharacterized protein